MSENLAIVEGNLGDDPELRYTPDGTPVCNLNVAVNKQWKDKNSGEKRKSTTWISVEVWNKLAESCAEYLKKGGRVYVRGELVNHKWEPVEGKTAIKTVVRAQKVTFL